MRHSLAAVTVALVLVAGALILWGSSEPDGVDRAREARVYEIAHTWSATIGDFDRDGWDDMILVRHKRGIRLYRNDGGRFTDVRPQAFRHRYEHYKDRHYYLFGDVDQNGRDDIYCTVGSRQGSGPGKPNELWIAQPDGTFKLETGRWGVGDRFGRGRFATFIDANGDRWPDLYVGNQYPRRDRHASVNRLFINERGRGFRNAPEFGLQRELGGESVQAVDFDGDGREDLLVCGEEGGPLTLMRNLRGRRFRDVSERIGDPLDCRFAMLADMDGDARPDLVRLGAESLTVSLQRDGEFPGPDYRVGLKSGKRFAIGDFDGDGLDDVYVVRSVQRENTPDRLLRNLGPAAGFGEFQIPHDREGRGQSVSAIDRDRDGRDEFIVMNGDHLSKGPVQLIEYRKP
jgi:hypothetical protein